MANQRSTFAKRQREQGLKNKANGKQARRAAKKDQTKTTKGPPIAWDEAVRMTDSDLDAENGDLDAEGTGDDGADDNADDTADDMPVADPAQVGPATGGGTSSGPPAGE